MLFAVLFLATLIASIQAEGESKPCDCEKDTGTRRIRRLLDQNEGPIDEEVDSNEGRGVCGKYGLVGVKFLEGNGDLWSADGPTNPKLHYVESPRGKGKGIVVWGDKEGKTLHWKTETDPDEEPFLLKLVLVEGPENDKKHDGHVGAAREYDYKPPSAESGEKGLNCNYEDIIPRIARVTFCWDKPVTEEEPETTKNEEEQTQMPL